MTSRNQNLSRVIFWSVCLFILWAVLFVTDIMIGTVTVPVVDTLKILFGYEPSDPRYDFIVGSFRIPKAIAASVSGACLAISGLLMQTLFRNPLAGPFILGTSSGASLGVAVLVLGTTSLSITHSSLLGDFSIIIAACIGAALLMGLVLFASQRVNHPVTLLIMGLMFGYAANALVSILINFSSAEQIQDFVNWNMGTFSQVTWDRMGLYVSILLVALIIAYLAAYPLNALLLGESYAKSMGMNVKRIRFWVICSASVLAATVTSFCGPVAFLGVAVPHVARRLLKRAEHRSLIPITALAGMSFALLSDIIAGVPGHDTALPLNAVSSLIGAPFVIFIILSRSKGRF